MKTLSRCLLAGAFVAGIVAVSVASAVYVDTSGRGQALIFPYYSAQSVSGSPFNTYLSVVNRTNSAKVIRVRFREGRHSREVATFNLYLGPSDTWTSAVVPSGAGARLITVDQSCVNGPFVADGGQSSMRRYDFTAENYTGSADDGLGTGLDRTREGFVEMIEMATLIGASAANVTPLSSDANAIAPANCQAVQGTTVALETAAPTGGLSGTLTLINVAKGMDFTVNAVALSHLTTQSFYRDLADPYPDFNASEVTPVSQFVVGDKTYRATWASGVDAVTSTLIANSIGNETILDSGTHSGTDWIITLPLLRLQVPPLTPPPTTFPPAATAGLPVTLSWSPRDGRGLTFVDQCGFLCPGDTYEVRPRLPWAATVMSFARGSTPLAAPSASSTVLGSNNAVMMTLPTTAENGAGSIDFGRSTSVRFQGTSIRISDGAVSTEAGTLVGAPVVGFMVRTFENGQLNCGGAICQGNYGGSFPHNSSTSVQP